MKQLVQLLAMRFLPMESHLAPPQASTAATYQPPIPHSRLLPPRPTIPTLLSPPPPPLLICLPMSGQWHPPQTEHSGGPLGDPSARVFEVFLIVSQSVSHGALSLCASLQLRASAPGCRRWSFRAAVLCGSSTITPRRSKCGADRSGTPTPSHSLAL